MRTLLAFMALWTLSALSAQAQSALQELANGNDARGWEAVGRLDIDGKGFCTGALIAPDLVLTAAHCLYETTGNRQVTANDIEFLAGLRNGRPEATRAARGFMVHPEYVHDTDAKPARLRYDVALIVLDRPIRSPRVRVMELSNSAQNGTEVGIISYAEGRQEAPSLQETCNVLGHQGGVLIMDCDVNFGASGSPVFRYEDGEPRLVSVLSAMSEIDGETVSIGPDLAQPLPLLMDQIEPLRSGFGTGLQNAPTTARVIRQGERNDTGALFVRP